ncbi:hypothetical protein ANO11243_031790 [Dothideomycetidae sp. 11243]|nr:hypothetical protein ANO11243_031790 [fungal sp. No.11243]
MSTVRDPAFWKRFSTAVHLNDIESTGSDSSAQKPRLDHQDSWLYRQEKKKKRRTIICCAFWLGLFGFAAVVVVVVVLLAHAGVFKKLDNKINNA